MQGYIFLLSLCLVFLAGAGANKNRLMTWLCLEFCDDTQQEIAFDLKQIRDHVDLFSAVSFEKYTLGANLSLIDNNLTPVVDDILEMGLEAWPLLSSYPHYPEFIDWMRQVFDHPAPFIAQCVSEAKKYKYYGYNLDWEPTDDCTADDGNRYAAFIDVFAKALHAEGLKLTVDIASWSPVWNLTAIAATEADRVISMATYTGTDSSFTTSLNTLVDAVDPIRAGVGLQMVNATDGSRLPLDEMKWRFDQIKALGVTEVDIWRSPVPPGWWPLLEAYVHG